MTKSVKNVVAHLRHDEWAVNSNETLYGLRTGIQ